MMSDKYIGKTSEVATFLMGAFNNSIAMTAIIVTAQAQQNTDKLVELLECVKNNCDYYITELKALK